MIYRLIFKDLLFRYVWKGFYTPNMRKSGDAYGVVAELARERGLAANITRIIKEDASIC